MIVRDRLDNGACLVTEAMPHVRSVSVGVWLRRGSRDEPSEQAGVAHFVEHMLFKGTATRTAEDIAQAIDSIGGQADAFTAKEYAGYYLKVLDEHLPLAIDILSDIVLNPAFAEEEIAKEKNVVLEEIKMVEDTPDDLVHELFNQHFWNGHALGRPILGTRDSVERITRAGLREYFSAAYTADHLIVVAVGNLEHGRVRDLVARALERLPAPGRGRDGGPGRGDGDGSASRPVPNPQVLTRTKEIEQSHICLGVSAYPQDDARRYAAWVLNTVLGGSMSSRLFQNVREKRGLAYSVFSSLGAYRDAGLITVYAGCANEAVGQVVDLIVDEMKGLGREALPETELRRAKDHLKGSLMLGLESTSGRMSHLARQEIYFEGQFGLDEMLDGIEQVTAADVLAVANELFTNGALGGTVLGGKLNGWTLTKEQLVLD